MCRADLRALLSIEKSLVIIACTGIGLLSNPDNGGSKGRLAYWFLCSDQVAVRLRRLL